MRPSVASARGERAVALSLRDRVARSNVGLAAAVDLASGLETLGGDLGLAQGLAAPLRLGKRCSAAYL